MATLATFEGIEENRGGIFGACLGACEMVASTVRGCLGYANLDFVKSSLEASKAAGSGLKAWMYAKESPHLISLGCMDFPIVKFNERYNTLLKNSPTLSPDAAAASVYFSMLAEQPTPTTEHDVVYTSDYDVETINHDAVRYEDWIALEESFLIEGSMLPSIMWPKFIKKDNAQNAYYDKLKLLQKYLKHFGLWGGIQKTLSEESRRLQGAAAAASASAAAAAKALAMARMNAETSQESRIEAAKQIANAENEYNRALDNEEKLKKAITNIKNGLPPDTPDLPGNVDNQKSSILPILGIAAAAAMAFMG